MGRKRGGFAERDNAGVQLAAGLRLAQLDLAAVEWSEIKGLVAAFFGRPLGTGVMLGSKGAVPRGPEATRALIEMRPGVVIANPEWPGKAEEASLVVAALQGVLHNLVRALVGETPTLERRGPSDPGCLLGWAEGVLALTYTLLVIRGIPAVIVGGPLPTVGVFHLFALLSHPAAQRIARCPECGTVFLKRWRRKHCSPRCRNRASARRRPPPTFEQRKKNAEAAHQRYARAKRREPGGTRRKVARRPRLGRNPTTARQRKGDAS